ncbi:MAG: hypothetical protein SFX73_29155 [Kofleriaceae bacterium]|nr:hypothetical protein [Kofleriaceae bacterium]
MKVMYLVAALALGACGDNIKNQPPGDGGITPDVAIDASVDAPIDAPPQTVRSACIDRPTDLPRPPTGALECNMLPPGFVEAQ